LAARVHDDPLRGSGGERSRPDRVPVVVDALADVDGQRDDLGAPCLADPLHGDGGVEATGVREHDSFRHRTLLAHSPARVASWDATFVPSAPSAQITSTVSSPATVPSTSCMPERSSAEPITCADPGGGRRTTRLPLCATSTTNSPITRRRWSSGALASLACSGIAYAIV